MTTTTQTTSPATRAALARIRREQESEDRRAEALRLLSRITAAVIAQGADAIDISDLRNMSDQLHNEGEYEWNACLRCGTAYRFDATHICGR